MQSYLSDNIKDNYYNKLSYILKKKNINFVLDSDFVRLYKKDIGLNFTVYLNSSNKPEFIICEQINDQALKINNLNITSTEENLKISEDINLNIDDYDTIEDIIYEIEKKKNINQLEKLTKNTNCNFKNKNTEKFLLLLDEKKTNLFTKTNQNQNQNQTGTKLTNYNLSNSNLNGIKKKNDNLFSLRACVEMLGDQVLKIYLSDNFDVNIDNFPNILIFMRNFTFEGSSDLTVTIDMKLDLDIFTKPPKIKITSNKILKDNILKVICELKPFSDINSWSVKYSIFDSVINIYNMINTYGETSLEFASEIDQIINDLEYLLSIRGTNISEAKLLEIFDKDFVKNKKKSDAYLQIENNKNTDKEKWKKGTGYGHDGLSKWDIDSYIKCVNEKKNNIGKLFNNFILKLNNDYINFAKFENPYTIEKIIKLLGNYLQNEDIESQNILLICNIILTNINFLNKLYPNEQTKSNKDINLSKLLDLLKNYCDDNDIKHKLFTDEIISNVIISSKIKSPDPFVNIFNAQSFVMFTGEFKTFYYKNLSNINSEKILKLKKELNIIKKSIEINSEASIFFWIEKNNLNKMKFIITGPANTPYDQGLYIFDMTLSPEYPTKPPLVHFSNHGGERFNPNLYNCGKVCLSLLGTWRGEKGESWNPETSTFFQILVSIQSQILIEEPYFNEPGHETYIGKAHGIASSKAYNDNIRKYNLDHAMCGLIEGIISNNSHYSEFDYIIRNYFKFKKDRIIDILNKWESEYTNLDAKNKFIASKEKFIGLVNKL
jgi:ubiquitin-protein ligase